MLRRNFIVVSLLLTMVFAVGAQVKFPVKRKQETKKEIKASGVSKPDSLAKPDAGDGLKPFKDIITKDAQTSTGFFKVHKVKDKYYFELPDSILDRDILVVNRISKAPVNRNKSVVGYPGDQIGDNVIRFVKGPNNKVFIKTITYIEQANDTLGMYQAVKNSNLQPIAASFPVQAVNKDTISGANNLVINMTEFLNSDNNVFFFDTNLKRQRGIGNIFGDRGYIDTIKAFPINIEIQTVKTYQQVAPQGVSPQMAQQFPTATLTYELNSSLVLLPKEPMKPRLFDPRVAYFAVRYVDFDSNPQGIDYKSKITRWRLEPRDEDLQKYAAGELVEPKKPIVFYIDPATPKKWVPYLIQGVNDWQKAFEKAGFKNAIVAYEAPADSSWSLEDARHSAIVYKPSDIPNASGPHVHDPRSGEIIETHINWYHNVMLLLRNWYLIQASPSDARARTLHFDDELMGQLIRFVSSHEVGHTLGLRHNFGSSATVPVEKLRDKAWVEANGHTPSIMDYARFNYVAQPEDSIGEAGLFPRIGIYDEWSIEWGYKYLPQFETPEDEIPYWNKIIIAKLQSDKRFTFGTETDRNDPRNQSEAIGDDAMLASHYGILNLKRIMPNILDWTREPDKGYDNAAAIYRELVTQYGRYMGHVTTNIGGIYSTPIMVEEPGNATEFVTADIQKKAMDFLGKQLFKTPAWLIDKKLIDKASVDPVNSIGGVQKTIIDRLISKNTIDKMLRDEAYNGASAYTALKMFADLKKFVWSELSSGEAIDIYRRNLQKNYVAALIKVANPTPQPTPQGGSAASAQSSFPSDASGIARAQLIDLNVGIRNALASASGIKRSHLLDLQAKIETALETRK